MKKKIGIFCFFVIMALLMLPVVASYDTNKEYPECPLNSGYLVIHVSTYTPGEGFHPYQGANISIRGLFYSYNGTTDKDGDCFFTVHTKLFRVKIYFAKVSIISHENVVTKRDFIYMLPREIEYKEYLFITFNNSLRE
jgi:hypothetical protein